MKKILEKLKKLFKKEAVFEKPSLMRPYHDWMVICACVFTILIALAFYSAYSFYGVNSGEAYQASKKTSSLQARSLDQGKVRDALSKLLDREGVFEETKKSPPLMATSTE